jgi:hypothetical protein
LTNKKKQKVSAECDKADAHPLKTKRNLFCSKNRLVPRSKHSISVIKTHQLTLYREVITAVLISKLCGQNVEFLTLNPVVHKAAIGLEKVQLFHGI